MFRVPKDVAGDNVKRYNDAYHSHFIVDLPNEAELEHLKAIKFSNNERNLQLYLDVVRAAGLRPGMSVLDFGASWGYLSWLLAEEGYQVYSYEVDSVRAGYAASHLQCKMIQASEALPAQMDCLFSAHVIEHLPTPRLIWQTAAKVLKPSGVVILFMPNGDPDREAVEPENYHSAWGHVHPMLLSRAALMRMADDYGFTARVYSASYPMSALEKRLPDPRPLTGAELLCVAFKKPTTSPEGL